MEPSMISVALVCLYIIIGLIVVYKIEFPIRDNNANEKDQDSDNFHMTTVYYSLWFTIIIVVWPLYFVYKGFKKLKNLL